VGAVDSRAGLGTRPTAALTAVTLAAVVLVAHGSAGRIESDGTPHAGEVAIFYYAWYGTPALDGGYVHWGQGGYRPPTDIASDFYPLRGPYSSSDMRVLRAQMREISSAGIDTVIVSWWGRESGDDERLERIADEAARNALRVAIHLEPYPGRSAASVATDLLHLRAHGITDVYVYDATRTPAAEWATVLHPTPGIRVFANTGLPGFAKAGGFDGFYTYDAYLYDGTSFPRVCASAHKLGLLCAPSVGPGYDAERATGDVRVRERRAGTRYDAMWRRAIAARADVVTVTSYNEWHEGTQIEPARAVGGPYASYDGAWGLRGKRAQSAYLHRTAWWATRYSSAMAR
jgi:glycoprotein endo-alpha-1,2-mannosidase